VIRGRGSAPVVITRDVVVTSLVVITAPVVITTQVVITALWPSSPAKAGDPVFQRRLRWKRTAAAYWILRFRGV
jgi:hypothetical protein